MNYVPVISSTLDAVGYDEASETLIARFKSGGEYEYFNVPETVFEGILSAPSAGKYFREEVKEAGYRYRRLR